MSVRLCILYRRVFATSSYAASVNHCSRASASNTAMSSSLRAPPEGDFNRAVELNALAWSWFAVSLTVVGLRFYSRIGLTRNLWWDDWFILLTLVRLPPMLRGIFLTRSKIGSSIDLHLHVDLYGLSGRLQASILPREGSGASDKGHQTQLDHSAFCDHVLGYWQDLGRIFDHAIYGR